MDPNKLLEWVTQVSLLLESLRSDIDKLEENAIDKSAFAGMRRQLDKFDQEYEKLRAYSEQCVSSVEKRMTTNLAQRLQDLGLVNYRDLQERVGKAEEGLNTLKKISLKYGLIGGASLAAGATFLGFIIWVVKGVATGDWSSPL